MGEIRLIAVDWGTSNRRAFALDAHGSTLAERHDDQGMLALSSADYEASFTAFAGDWLSQRTVVLICGMAGSRMGWVEAPYLACPVDPARLASGLVRAPSAHRVYVVPGVSFHDGREPDVMRGEETKVLGLGLDDGIIFSPGTHPKWIVMEKGEITRFRSYMTGELHAMLQAAGTLAQLMVDGPFDEDAFMHGVARGRATPDLSHALFGVRTLGFFGTLPPAGLRSYLSGLLIGTELADMLASMGDVSRARAIGSEALVAHYRLAAGMFGLELVPVPAERLVAGALWRLALEAGVVYGKE